MESRLVLTLSEIDRASLRAFVLEHRGMWEEQFCHGIFERGAAAVYACVEPVDREMHAACAVSWTQPSWVVLYVGGGQGSAELASHVAEQMVSTWGGSVDAIT